MFELFALSALVPCSWIYPQNPATTVPECVEFAYPSAFDQRKFHIKDSVYSLTLEQALSAQLPLPTDVLERHPRVTREFQHLALRNVAYHLGRAEHYLRQVVKRNTPSKPIAVTLTKSETGQGLLSDSRITIGGAYALMSEVVYHEYAHHVVEWENPGVTASRAVERQNAEGHAVIEAYANHLAFVLDDEPRFAEYNQARFGGDPLYSYSVETACTLRKCDQPAARAGEVYKYVIVFGALLWDIKKQFGADESVALMLDSIRRLDVKSVLTYESAVQALAKGKHGAWILERANARRGERLR